MTKTQRETLARLLDPDGPAALPEAARAAVAALLSERDTLIACWPWEPAQCVVYDCGDDCWHGQGGSYPTLEAAVRATVGIEEESD
jgi:hypothetical protein